MNVGLRLIWVNTKDDIVHHKVKMCLVLPETTKPSFQVAVPLACPLPTDERSCCSTSSIAFGGVCVSDFHHPNMNHQFLTQLESGMCSRVVGVNTSIGRRL